MQQLLSGKIRLPGFQKKPGFKKTEVGMIPEDWEVKQLNNLVTFLDHLKKPLSKTERLKMHGKFPYYGASGIIDYVNNYIFDDEFILLAEDGENILSRNLPIAFKIKGKIWVNNHAHVLKPKIGLCIEFLTHSLERLDYKKYNSSSAQPKLTKETCKSLPIPLPPLPEQTAIAKVLSDMDAEIDALIKRREKTRAIKKGMMQQLLTGRIRLVEPSGQTNTQAGNERK